MNNSIGHLPVEKQAQLRAISAAIQEMVQVELIILFGSFARGNWVEDDDHHYYSDYDLMVIVLNPDVAQDHQLWRRVTARVKEIAGSTPVTLLPHTLREVNEQIRTGQYFFSEVACQGIALYSANRCSLATPMAATQEERVEAVLFNFRYWFNSASAFWRGAAYYMAQGLTPQAAFLLHQATERYCHTVLLVYTGYKPKSHDIEALAKGIALKHESLNWELSWKGNKEHEHLFNLLMRAYIDSRYSKSYYITLDELAELRRHILNLAGRVRDACAEKLKTITTDGDLGELPRLPGEGDPFELPLPPALDDPKAVEAWHEAIVQMSRDASEKQRKEGREEGERAGEERGREEGRQEGREEGRQEGREEGERIGEERGRELGERVGEERGREEGRREERARAILEVLRRRGVPLSDAQVQVIATCRDDAQLAKWGELAWTVATGAEMIGEE